MTPRSFWKILLKISGLWLFVQSLPVVMQNISQVFIYLQHDEAGMFYGVFFTLLSVALSLGCLYLLIFKTEWIITKLQLDKGFAEEIFAIKMHRSAILTITITIIGILMLIDSIPAICQQVYTIATFRASLERVYDGGVNYTWLIFYIVKAFIGILVIIYTRDLVNFIEVKRKASSSDLFIEPAPEKPEVPEDNKEILKHFES